MSELQLSRITVRTASDAGAGDVATPDGTKVFLDTPGGNFDFAEYEVSGGHLTVPRSGSAPATLDTQYRYWCVWGPPSLQAPRNGQFQIAQGFGYPLPVRFNGRRLILPNTRRVRVVWFNLTEQTHVVTAAMTPAEQAAATAAATSFDNRHNAAVQFYRDLHIELTFVNQAPPATIGAPPVSLGLPWFLRGERLIVNIPYPSAPYTQVHVNLSDAAWRPSGDLTNTILLFWVQDFVDMGAANGAAWPYLHVLRMVLTKPNQAFPSPTLASFFMRRNITLGTGGEVAHEIGHCLLSDPGLGRRAIASLQGHEAQVQAFLGRLGIEGPPPPGVRPSPARGSRLYAELFEAQHAPNSLQDNLMGRHGGSALLPWQVAVMRASQEVGDRP